MTVWISGGYVRFDRVCVMLVAAIGLRGVVVARAMRRGRASGETVGARLKRGVCVG